MVSMLVPQHMVFKHNVHTACAVASVHDVCTGSSAWFSSIICIQPVQFQMCMVSVRTILLSCPPCGLQDLLKQQLPPPDKDNLVMVRKDKCWLRAGTGFDAFKFPEGVG